MVYALFGPAVHGVVARVTTLLLLVSGVVGLVTSRSPVVPEWALWPLAALATAIAADRVFGRVPALVAAAVVGVLALAALVVFATPGLALRVGWLPWLFWVGMIVFVIRVDHPPVLRRERLTPGRTALGVLCLVVFAMSFSIQPIQVFGR